jgi:hypothetical protein
MLVSTLIFKIQCRNGQIHGNDNKPADLDHLVHFLTYGATL